jgi:phosphopantothenoylcysteine decarboxylase/phosphopantothenate--cysteine ligase
VVSAKEMYQACLEKFKKADILVMAAAVADFAPAKQSLRKIKKKGSPPVVELESTPDILAALGKIKKSSQVIMGFALETENGMANAKEKLKKKNLDFIVLNSVSEKHSAFRHDTNKATVITSKNKITNFELMPKSELADTLVRILTEKIKKK